jgi:hypothetical protein
VTTWAKLTRASECAYLRQIQPLIGTADESVYLRTRDVEKRGLEFTGMTVPTRQGLSKAYVPHSVSLWPIHESPASYQLQGRAHPNPLRLQQRQGQVHLVARLQASHGAHIAGACASANSKKERIIGVPILTMHVVFSICNNIHIFGLSVLEASLALHKCFEHMSSMGTLIKEHGSGSLSLKSVPGNALAVCLDLARRLGPPPFSALDADLVARPVLRLSEVFRACGRAEGSGAKLVMRKDCRRKKGPRRAPYCGDTCQAADWEARYRDEHAGRGSGSTRASSRGAPLDATRAFVLRPRFWLGVMYKLDVKKGVAWQ